MLLAIKVGLNLLGQKDWTTHTSGTLRVSAMATWPRDVAVNIYAQVWRLHASLTFLVPIVPRPHRLYNAGCTSISRVVAQSLWSFLRQSSRRPCRFWLLFNFCCYPTRYGLRWLYIGLSVKAANLSVAGGVSSPVNTRSDVV
ncbi:hypothetical protein J6590_059986 [Homalodisca vitripennis]|nr:hypothetical protein J6590_059986 [Homalodisca vitripennis]